MNKSVETAQESATATMRSIIQRIATGPVLSKNISREEARAGMRAILEGEVDPVQAAIFLIALRMKRETDEEFLGVLDAVREATNAVTAAVDELIDVADPYDGYNRILPSSPFLPAVLAACGVPAVSHGVASMGPKYGVTHRRVLDAFGLAVDLSPADAAARISDSAIGWAYIDQARFNPKLYRLAELRSLIVKRPALTTVEVLAGPLRGRNKTHFVTGYVHTTYPRIYAMLARTVGFDSALLVRGVEGGVVPSLRQTGKVFYYHDKGEEQSIEIKPADLGIKQEVRATPLPDALSRPDEQGEAMAATLDAVAEATAQAGREALEGKPGPTRDGLVYAAAVSLWHLGRHDSIQTAAQAVRDVLDSGKALARMKA